MSESCYTLELLSLPNQLEHQIAYGLANLRTLNLHTWIALGGTDVDQSSVLHAAIRAAARVVVCTPQVNLRTLFFEEELLGVGV